MLENKCIDVIYRIVALVTPLAVTCSSDDAALKVAPDCSRVYVIGTETTGSGDAKITASFMVRIISYSFFYVLDFSIPNFLLFLSLNLL